MIHATLRSSGSAAVRALGALTLLATLAGCSFGTMEMSGPESGAGSFTLQGRAYGGSSPDVGATVQVWAAGTTGYGSGATLLSTSSATTDASGFFSLTGKYSCASVTTPVYVTATGGNPGAGTNSAIRFVSAIGTCATLQNASYVWINEVTTAAAGYALAQYATTTNGTSATDTIGAPNTTQAQTGLTNAFATVANLVNSTNGTAQTTLTLTGTGGTITGTPEAAKLYTVADILAACANSTGSSSTGCQTLFTDVTPSGGTAPTDTFQAAAMLNLNPTSNNSNGSTNNIAALYALENANSPFVSGGMTSAPTDWTLAISYANTTALPYPNQVAVDASGNVWVMSQNSSASGALTELSPNGTPQAVVTSIGGQTITALTPRNIAIDLNGNVWMPTSTSSAYIVEYGNGGAVSGAFSTGKSSYGIAIDGNNNVFVGTASSSDHVQLYEFPAGTTLTSSSTYSNTNNIEFPLASTTPGTASPNGTTVFGPQYMAFDTNGNLWMSSGSFSSAEYPYLVQLSNIDTTACASLQPCYGDQSKGSTSAPWSASTSPDPTFGTSATVNTYTFTTANLGGLNEPNGIATAPGGGIWAASIATGNQALSLITSTTAGTNYGTTANIASPRFVAVDGAGNAWVSNRDNAIAGGSVGGSVSEVSSTGATLSPTSSSPSTTNPGYVHAALANANGIAVDQAGNVWVADNNANGVVVEIVGAGAPTVQPLAQQLASHKVGGRP